MTTLTIPMRVGVPDLAATENLEIHVAFSPDMGVLYRYHSEQLSVPRRFAEYWNFDALGMAAPVRLCPFKRAAFTRREAERRSALGAWAGVAAIRSERPLRGRQRSSDTLAVSHR